MTQDNATYLLPCVPTSNVASCKDTLGSLTYSNASSATLATLATTVWYYKSTPCKIISI